MTTMMGVPATYLFIAQEPRLRARRPLDAAARGRRRRADARALLETWRERGVEIVQGYGLTEAAPNVLCLPPEDAGARPASPASRTRTSTSRCGSDTASSSRRRDGRAPRRGPNVFAGYWRNPEATAAAFARRLAAHRRRRRARRGGLLPDRAAGSRTWSSPAARTCTRRRSRTCCTPTRPWSRRRSSACRTSAGARSAPHSSCSRPAPRRRGRAARALPRAARALQGAEDVHLRRRAAAHGVGKVLKDELRAAVTEGRDDATPPTASTAGRSRSGRAHARAACSRRRSTSSPARLPRRLDREDHRGRRRRAGHLLPLLREQEGDLRRARRDLNRRVRHAMTEAAVAGRHPASRRSGSASGVLPVHGRAPGALPDHPAGGVRLAGDAPLPLRAASRGLRRGAARGDRGRRDRRGRPGGAAWALMGIGELIGMRWMLWDGSDEMPRGRARRARADHPWRARRRAGERASGSPRRPLPAGALDDRGRGRAAQRDPGAR